MDGLHIARAQEANSSYSDRYNWLNAKDPIADYMSHQQDSSSEVSTDNIGNPLAREALSHLGIRYRFGGKSPETGFDCSGLVFYSAQASLGLKLPPRSDELARLGSNIDRDQLQVGDLVFFNTMGRRFSHVGVYLGDSKFVHSPATGGVVRVEDMHDRYWDRRFTGARRLEGTEFASASPMTSVDDSSPISIPSRSLTSVAPNRPQPTNTAQAKSKGRVITLVKDKSTVATRTNPVKSQTVSAKGTRTETSSVNRPSAESPNKQGQAVVGKASSAVATSSGSGK